MEAFEVNQLNIDQLAELLAKAHTEMLRESFDPLLEVRQPRRFRVVHGAGPILREVCHIVVGLCRRATRQHLHCGDYLGGCG